MTTILPSTCEHGRCSAPGAWHRHTRAVGHWVSACDAHAWLEVSRVLTSP